MDDREQRPAEPEPSAFEKPLSKLTLADVVRVSISFAISFAILFGIVVGVEYAKSLKWSIGEWGLAIVFGIGALIVGFIAFCAVGALVMTIFEWMRKNWQEYWWMFILGSLALLSMAVTDKYSERFVIMVFGVGTVAVLALCWSILKEAWKKISPHSEKLIAMWNELPRYRKVAVLAVLLLLTPLAVAVYQEVQWLNDQRGRGPWEKYRTSAEPAKEQKFDWNQYKTVETSATRPRHAFDGKPEPDNFETHAGYVLALTEWNLKAALREVRQSPARVGPPAKKPISDHFATHAEFVEALIDWKVRRTLSQRTRTAEEFRSTASIEPDPDTFENHSAYVEALIDWKISQVLSQQHRRHGSNSAKR